MSETSLSMSLPLDTDGFLRRACPHCQREFKWRPTQDEHDAAEERGEPTPAATYVCPYCYEPADPGAWFTTEQVEYAKQIALAEVAALRLRALQNTIEGMNRPGGFIQIRAEVTMPDMAYPQPLTECTDMARIEVPCHLGEPLKVDEAWTDEIACRVCGIRYPIDLVRALPAADVDE